MKTLMKGALNSLERPQQPRQAGIKRHSVLVADGCGKNDPHEGPPTP